MFKKTLLALAVSSAALSTAQAATVYVDVTNNAATPANFTVTPAAGEALGVLGVIGGGDDNCDVAATDLGATLTGTVANVASAGSDDDTITTNTLDGLFLGANRVAMTGLGTCDVSLKSSVVTDVLKHSIERSTVDAIEITPSIVAGIGGYRDEDTITINIAGAKIDLSETTAPTLVVAGAAGVSLLPVDVEFKVLDISESQVRFTLQTTDALKDYVVGGAVLDLAGVFLDSEGLSTSTTVSVSSFATNTSGTQFDPAAATAVATLVPQYTAEVTNDLDAKIDVGADRQQFENSNTSDVLNFAVEKNTTGLELTPATASYTITGDFSWIAADFDANDDGKLSSAEIGAAVAYAAANDTASSYALNKDLNALTINTTVVGGAVDAAHSVTFTVKGYDNGVMENAMIPVQDFTLAASVFDNKAFSTKAVEMPALSASDAGEWRLNGSIVVLPYMPFGGNTQPIIRHTNAGTRTGDISLRYMVEGEHTEWQNIGVLIEDAEPGVRNLLTPVTDALADEGYTGSFKVALEFVTNVPENDVWVFGGAKVTTTDSDRINISTSSAKSNRY